jgi:putative ABC transport system permease protein
VIDGWLPSEGGRVRVLGIDPVSMPPGGTVADSVQSGGIAALFEGQGAILAAPATADRLRAAVTNAVIATETMAPGLALMDISTAARLLDRNAFDRLLIAPDQSPLRRPLDQVAPGLRIEPAATAEDLGRLTDSFHLNLTAFGLLSFAVGLFIVNGAVGLAFEQRRPVFRTLRALGVPSALLVVLLIVELLIFALIAGAIGILLGYILAGLLLPGVAATLRGIYGATVEGTLTLSPAWWISGLGIAALGTAAASATGLVRVARMPPLAPARPRAWAMATGRSMRHQLVLAGLCLAAALSAMTFGSGLAAGFVLLGGLLLAAALALPSVLSACLALAARTASGPLPTWFWADTRQQLPGLSLALMALLLALAANIGVGTMVESFRKTFTGWLDQWLVSDLYVTLDDDTRGADLLRFLENRAEGVLPIWHIDGEVLGGPVEIYGVVDHPVYIQNWPLLDAAPDAWNTVHKGNGALVNEQLARRHDLKPGDALDLPQGLTTIIAGVYSDYGNPIGQIVIALPLLTATYDQIDRSDFGILTGGRTDALRAELVSDFGLPEENMIDQAALKAFSLSIFERTFAVTGVLNVLTLGVAGFAILTSLLTLASMRLPQLAPVWALGVTRAELGRIELIRALTLAALTFLLSIPVGLGLAWVLLAVINLEAFGWRLPMFLFPGDWLRLGLLSLAAAGLASLWPAWRLARRPPADLIRVFAQER